MEYAPHIGKLYHIRYPVEGTDDFVTVATTRPELEFYLGQWVLKKYAAYPILYLASHGEQFGILTLNNPKKINALSQQMIAEIIDLLGKVAADEAISYNFV